MLTRDQKYASTVYDQVCKVKIEKQEKQEYKKYGAMAHKLPILIYTVGLVRALEFVNARAKKPIQQRLLEDIAVTVGYHNTDTLLKIVRSADLSSYMLLTRQILAALLWYKRFAQSVLGVEASNSDPTLDGEVSDAESE